jgi:hypothetical protein
MRIQLAATAIAAALLLAVAASSGQEVRSVPGPGTGIVTVRGTVDIGGLPDVRAVQTGDWKVAISNTPNVRVAGRAPLDFVQAGRRYRVTWFAGDPHDVVIRELGSGGWVRAEMGGRRGWINLDQARSIEEP